MATNKNYYDILGVPKDASQDDIKKAYRSLAKKYHPDICKEPNANERFAEIQVAYDCLSDPEKRSNYDRFGTEDINQGFGGAEGFSGFSGFEDIFSSFFGGGSSSSGGASKLADLSDVYISGISNGQALVYSAINNKWINTTINNSGNTGGNTGDLSKYLLASDAEKLYLLKTGGTITGNLNINGLTTLGNNLLVKGGVTMYNE